jgi:hypothetical protein
MDAADESDDDADVADADEVALASTRTRKRLARLALVAFVFTFVAARVIVYLIMSRRIPDLYFFVGQTHVHHLNYGIFLLSAAGAVLLFGPRSERSLRACALLYGVGLALTFDEFGLWLHLGGPYWQRPSLDAIVVVAALLTLVALAPPLRRFGRKEMATTALLVIATGALAAAMLDVVQRSKLTPRLERLEEVAPH